MVSEFKFFQRNKFKDRCRLQIGSSVIIRGRYCIVTRMWNDWFELHTQETGYCFYMSYKDYLTTQSAAGRQLNRM